MRSPGLANSLFLHQHRDHNAGEGYNDPTERSIPPERITKVSPSAVIPRKALSLKKSRKTDTEKNLGKATAAAL